jgi:transposase
MPGRTWALPHETVVDFFHRYFSLGHSIIRIARETGVHRQTVENRLGAARRALGDVRYQPGRERADEAFTSKMRAAIAAGQERAPVKISTDPSTDRPRKLIPSRIGSMTSSSGW